MKRFFIACPKGIQTGGPEALHQLASAIRKLSKFAFLWDPDNYRKSQNPISDYSHYGDLWTDELPLSDDCLIFPETMADLVPKFYGKVQICIWWLSVDNYFNNNKFPISFLNKFPEIIHMYQSEYAHNFLVKNQFTNLIRVTDYINLDFMADADFKENNSQDKSKLLAINPAKGFERSKLVLENLKTESVVLLENMNRSEVLNSLKSSKIYLDLGNHPGTDRIPREAALARCIVLTNQRGSALNNFDIPINKEIFKFDDSQPGFANELSEVIKTMGDNYEKFIDQQREYSVEILKGFDNFHREVDEFVKLIENWDPANNELNEKDSSFTQNLVEIWEERESLVNQNQNLNFEKVALESKIEKILNSRSWRFTKILRKLNS